MRGDLIPVPAALAILQRATVSEPWSALLLALRLGEVASSGTPFADGEGPEPIPAERWAEWQFHLERHSLDPPSRRRISTGYSGVRVSRSDVDRLADRTDRQPDKTPPSKPIAKPALPEEIARTLEQLHPYGRPPDRKTRELAAEAQVKLKLQREISESTMKRALQIAWK